VSDRLASMSRFDESVSEPKVIAECPKCHEAICVGDEVHRIDDGGGLVHNDCAAEYAMESVYDYYGIVGINGELE